MQSHENLSDYAYIFQIQTHDGWRITDIAETDFVDPTIDPLDETMFFTSDMTAHLNYDIYWTAPRPYIGNKVFKACNTVIARLILIACFMEILHIW